MNAIEQNSLFLELKELLHPQDFEVLKQILNRSELDLAPEHGYFEQNDFEKIVEKSQLEFLKRLKTFNPISLDGEDMEFAWKEVIHQFQKNHWGFKKYQEKPILYREPRRLNLLTIAPADLPAKKRRAISYKDAFFYIWSVLQAMIITKALILVFGNELAKDDSTENRIFFGAVILFSFGSLFLFAWMRRKNPK